MSKMTDDLTTEELTEFRAHAEKLGIDDSALVGCLVRKFLRESA